MLIKSKLLCRTISFLMVLIICLGFLPKLTLTVYAAKKATSTSDVVTMLNSWKSKLNGKYWNYYDRQQWDSRSAEVEKNLKAVVDNGYINASNPTNAQLGVTTTKCPGYDFAHGCKSNYFSGGWQCAGFAWFIEYALFQSTYSFNSSDWNAYSGSGLNSISLQPGDLVRLSGHSAVVSDVSGGALKCVECWGGSPTNNSGCKINWSLGFNSDQYTTPSKLLDGCKTNGGTVYRYKGLSQPDPGPHTHTKGEYVYYEKTHPHRSCYRCSICGEIWAEDGSTNYMESCPECNRPAKPVISGLASTYTTDDSISIKWTQGENTTHCNYWLYYQDGSEWKYLNRINYASSPVTETLGAGNYRVHIVAYNSNYWEDDGSDWVHTFSDYAYFTVIPAQVTVTCRLNGGSWPSGASDPSGQYKLGSRISLPTPVRTGYKFVGWNVDLAGSGHLLEPWGVPLNAYPSFSNSMGDVEVYNNFQNGNVTVERVAKTSDCPTSSQYMLKVRTAGEASPFNGGFCQPAGSKASGVFYHVIVAKIPVGNQIETFSNAIGDNSVITWLTPQDGTGRFETYIYKVTCGATGTFSSFGFVALKGRIGTKSDPLEWYVGYSEVFDGTGVSATGNTYTVGNGGGTLSAMWRETDHYVDIQLNGGEWPSGNNDPSGEYKRGSKIDLATPERDGYDFAGWALTYEGDDHVLEPWGVPQIAYPSYGNTMDNAEVYNNYQNGNVTVERVAKTSDCPTSSSYMLKVKTAGEASPFNGGFCQPTGSKASGVFYHVIVAKIPVGNQIETFSNAIGDNSVITWLTPQDGTGQFETYIYKVECGATGTFSSFGFVALKGRIGTKNDPLEWYVGYSEVFEGAGVEAYNNFLNGNVMVERVAKSSDCPTSSPYMLKVRTAGEASPWNGGFCQPTGSKASGVFYHVIVAKIPVGNQIETFSNAIGDNSAITWLTPQDGTGQFETYIYKVECGATGTFSSFGFVCLKGRIGTKNDPLEWYVGYSGVFDGTGVSATGNTYTVGSGSATLSAMWASRDACADGHSYSYSVTKEPTVSAAGVLTGTCERCQETTSISVPKLSTTDYTYSVTKAATCTATGTGRYTWKTTTYGTFSFDVTIPKAAHSYKDTVTAPTCTEKGYTTHTCSVCGDSYKDTETAALGHDYVNGICTRCGAKDPNQPGNAAIIRVSATRATQGETFSVPVKIEKNNGFAGFTFQISAPAGITLTDIAKGSLLKSIDSGSFTKNVQQSMVNWTSSEKLNADGELFVLTFQVGNSVPDGEYPITLSLRDGKASNFVNENSQPLDVSFVSGTVEVSSVKKGDLNGDGDITSADSVKLARYLVSLETLTNPAMKAADLNDDGDVTSSDAVMLARYLVGLISTLGELDAVPEADPDGELRLMAADGPTIQADTVTGNPGESVTVPVRIQGNTGFAGFTLVVDYDDALTLESIRKGSLLNESDGGAFTKNEASGLINWTDSENLTGDGILFNLNFKIPEGATGGTYPINLSLREGKASNFVDENSVPIPVVFASGVVKLDVACEHNYVPAVTAPTCTEKGFTTYTCSKCGDSYTGDEVTKLGHDYKDGVCTRCGEKDPDYVPPIDKAALQTAIAAAEKIDRNKFTDETVSALETALAKAKAVQADHKATQEQINEAAAAVSTAVAGLKEKSGAPENPFVDVKEGAYYYDPVLWAVEKGVTTGTSATTFSPDKTCTRAQVVTFLWRANGCPEPTKTDNPFSDVKPDAYYYKAVMWAVENGITSGTSKNTFSPDSGCTRGQVVTFQWRANGKPEPTSARNPFTDVKSDAYYYKAVLWAVENNITKGTSADKFSPDSTCTRGQIVTFLYRDMK